MKRFWIFVIGLFLLFDTVTAASQKSVLQFTKMVWNFGTIQEKDGPVSCRFDFVNTGKTPIVIEKVTVGCGCTTPKFSKEPVRPGAKGSITVTYNPKDRPGAFRKEITVRSTGGGEDVLSVTGDVVPSPKTTADRYTVLAGDIDSLSWGFKMLFVFSVFASVALLGLVIILEMNLRRNEIAIYMAMGESKLRIIIRMLGEYLLIIIAAFMVIINKDYYPSSIIIFALIRPDFQVAKIGIFPRAGAGQG